MKRLTFWLLAFCVTACLPTSVRAADFSRAAAEVRGDLQKALKEKQSTLRDLADRRASLEKRAAALKASLDSEIARLERAQKELARVSRQRAELSRQAAEESGDFKAVAGHVRAAARDLLALAEHSPVTAEHPARLDELRAYLNKSRFPGLDDIKKLADLYFQEMTASGRIARRRGKLVDRAGREVEGDIVRLGGFSTIYRAGDEIGFLLLGPSTGRLLAVGAEPSWGVRRTLASYMDGDSDLVYLDISGGAALRSLSKRVGLWERLLSGGPLIWPILLVGLVSLVFILERLFFLQRVRANTDELMVEVGEMVRRGDFAGAEKAARAQEGRPTANVMLAGLGLRGSPPEVIESGLAEAMLRELPRLERFLATLKVLAAVAPLLGLLGTVTGMINTFQVITVFGTGDPRLMAGGISEALVTTQLGLTVAIPVLVAASLLGRKAQRITGDMEEKAVALSAALIQEAA